MRVTEPVGMGLMTVTRNIPAFLSCTRDRGKRDRRNVANGPCDVITRKY